MGRLILRALFLQKWLQSLPVHLERAAIFWILNLNGPIRKHWSYYERACPSRSELPWKQMQTWIVKKDLLTGLEESPQYILVVNLLHLCFVHPSTIISIVPQLIQFIELELPLWASLCEIEIQLLNGPVGSVLQLHRQMSCFFVHDTVRWHANRRLERCSVCP